MTTRPPLRAPGPVLLAGSTVGAVLAVILFRAGLPILDTVVLTLLLALLPAVSVVQVQLLGDMEIERLPAYVSSALTLVVLGAGTLVVGARGLGLEGMGFGAFAPAAAVGWALALTAGGVALVWAFRQAALLLGLGESPLLRALMPRTPRERGVFVVLALAAGVAEETAYRGYALTALGAIIGPLWAAVATSIVFGVLHAYQGVLGVLRTASLGGLLAWGFLATGSLWPVVGAHALLDLVLGLLLADRMMVPPAAEGVRQQASSSSRGNGHGSGSGASG